MLTLASVVFTAALQTAAPVLADAYFYFLQGRMLEGRGDVTGAMAAYRHAAELQPKVASIHSELAGLYARAGRADDAISEGEAAVSLDKADREANRILGLVKAALAENLSAGARQTQLMNDAIGNLEQALVGGRDPGAELTLGRLNVRTNRLAKGIDTLKTFLSDNPGYPEAVMLLAEAYERSDKLNDAIEVLSPLADGPDAQTEVQAMLASLLEQSNRWKEAAALWGRLASKSPDPSYRMQQAGAMMNDGNVTGARDVLTAATKDRPRDPSVWYLLAQAERRLGNVRGAEDASRRITEIDAADPRGPLAMAEAKEAAGDFAGVVAVLQPLYDRRRADPRANDEVFSFVAMTLANAYQELKQFDRAEEALRALVARDANDDVALNALGYLLIDRGIKLDEAIGFVRRALAVDPASPSYLDSLGWAFVKQRKFAEAIAPLEQAAKGAANSSLLQDHLGDAYFALKRYRDAADAYARALTGDRDGVDVTAVTKKRDKARDLARHIAANRLM